MESFLPAVEHGFRIHMISVNMQKIGLKLAENYGWYLRSLTNKASYPDRVTRKWKLFSMCIEDLEHLGFSRRARKSTAISLL